MKPAPRPVRLVICAALLAGCAMLGPLTLLSVVKSIQDGEVLFTTVGRDGRPIYDRWDTQPVAFVFTIGMWLTLALAFFSGIRPMFRRLKAAWLEGKESPPRGPD
jgi:hypothetical protein